MDDLALGKRVFKDLINAFEKEKEIVEYDIIKVIDNSCNKSPVLTIDHHLAIESWCLKSLYIYVYSNLIKHNEKSLSLPDKNLNELTKVMLLLNPDLTFVWNLRRKLIKENYLETLNELKLSELILKKKPKCPNNFYYRQTLINFLLEKNQFTEELIKNELKICARAADMYSSNYNAWNYRFFIVKNFSNFDLVFLIGEINCIQNWINKHISDYSGYHYRQLILIKIFSILKTTNKEKIVNIIKEEYDNNKILFKLYPDQEALFCHRRFLLKMKDMYLCLNKLDELEEKNFITTSLSVYNSIKKQWLLTLINRYIKWAKINFNLDLN